MRGSPYLLVVFDEHIPKIINPSSKASNNYKNSQTLISMMTVCGVVTLKGFLQSNAKHKVLEEANTQDTRDPKFQGKGGGASDAGTLTGRTKLGAGQIYKITRCMLQKHRDVFFLRSVKHRRFTDWTHQANWNTILSNTQHTYSKDPVAYFSELDMTSQAC